jgi:hypothetical protein
VLAHWRCSRPCRSRATPAPPPQRCTSGAAAVPAAPRPTPQRKLGSGTAEAAKGAALEHDQVRMVRAPAAPRRHARRSPDGRREAAQQLRSTGTPLDALLRNQASLRSRP